MVEREPDQALLYFLGNVDTTSFGRKSIGQMTFSWHVMVRSVGQNDRTNDIIVNSGDGN